jgi:hypothetical protein
MDPSQVIRDGAKLQEGLAIMADGVQKYFDKKEARKAAAAKMDLENRKLKTKRYVADKGYSGKVDSARIRAKASDRSNMALLKKAKIDFDAKRYVADKGYKKTIDGKYLDIQKQKIASSGTIKAAAIRADANKYKADRSVENNKRTTAATEKQAEATVKAAKIRAATAAEKKRKAALKKSAAKLDLSGTNEDILKQLHNRRKKKSTDIGDMEIS